MREAERLTRLARRDHRRRRATHALGVLPGRIGPEAKRHADRLVTGIAHTKERNGAVDATAHRDGDAPFVGSRANDWTERVVKRVRGETLAGNGRSIEKRAPLDLAEKLRQPRPLSGCMLDPLSGHGQPHPGEISVPGGVSDELARRGHTGMVP